ncbi:MAG TPA: ATP-binding protein [Candidatus Dormibacteraeota bacterium]|nr:ATP-binding protein [Candidatus Dormibacteraeota bacterium]
MARELHDGPIQSLTESVLQLEGYRVAAANPTMRSAISDLEERLHVALMSLRHLISDLRGEAPDEDIAAQVREMAGRYQSSAGIEIAVVVSPAWPARLNATVALNLMRVVQEAITNAVRHSRARHILVELSADDASLAVSVSDDGYGIAPGTPPGSGMMGMNERAALLGGRLHIRRREPGTEIRLELPLP